MKPSLTKNLSTYLQLGWLERLSSKKEVMGSNLGPIAALTFYFYWPDPFPLTNMAQIRIYYYYYYDNDDDGVDFLYSF